MMEEKNNFTDYIIQSIGLLKNFSESTNESFLQYFGSMAPHDLLTNIQQYYTFLGLNESNTLVPALELFSIIDYIFEDIPLLTDQDFVYILNSFYNLVTEIVSVTSREVYYQVETHHYYLDEALIDMVYKLISIIVKEYFYQYGEIITFSELRIQRIQNETFLTILFKIIPTINLSRRDYNNMLLQL